MRVLAANLPGDSQTYGAAQIRILQGLKPDVVAIQEFNHSGTTRSFVDHAFGTNFSFFRESGGYSIPNGIISRWPILASGSWVDTVQTFPNRGFAWAQIDLPGDEDLYVVSVHFLTTSSANRANEAANLKALIQSTFPAAAWIIVAGDLNTDSRNETAMTTLTTFLSDHPVPTDAENGGNPDTNLNRNKPYDYVLPSFSLTNRLTNVVFAARSFPNGLVFDSRVYSPLSDVSPIQFADSSSCQHMAVLKDFLIPAEETDPNLPAITQQPQSRIVPPGVNVPFTVTATGASPLSYQWRFNNHDLPGATTANHTVTNAQITNAGNYVVVITNTFGSITSDVAVLTVDTNPPGTPTVLAGWDVSPLSNYGPSPLPPTTNAAHLTITGLTRGGGIGTSGTAASRAWGGNGFDSATPAAAISAGDYATFSITAQSGFKVSFTSISRFDYRRSSTGPPNGVLQYQIGNGAFTDAAALAYPTSTSGGASLAPIDLSSVNALQSVSAGQTVTFRIVNYAASGSGGTWYLYDVANSSAPDLVVEGIVASVSSPPPAVPTLLQPALNGDTFTFTLNGTAGTNYVIEFSTNLTGGNWIALRTNAAPFSFSDLNASVHSQRFYRAFWKP